MQLPQSKARQIYIDQIKTIEANLKDATSGEISETLLSQVQKRIDTLAEKYQYSEEIGIARYKLYELQALVHYFGGDDDDALDFINQAIATRGDSYTRAEKLKAQLLAKTTYSPKTIDSKKMTKQERRKRLIGLEGWLAFFTVSIGLTTLVYCALAVFSIINLNSLSSTSDGYSSSLLSPYYGFSVLISVIMVGLGIWLTILLAKRRKLARWIGIAFAATSFIFSYVDYMWYADLITKITGLPQNSSSSGAGMAIIWIIYLCVSRRVKRTLTK